jgi:hypothetical protein
MTREEKIEFLSRYLEIDEEINRLCSELSMWRARATKITPTYSDMPKGGQQENSIQSAIEKIIVLEQEINVEIDHLQDTRQSIWKAIRSVGDVKLRRVLSLRYLDNRKRLTWEQIAIEMDYDLRQIYRIHNSAIDSIECHAQSMISLQ